MKPEIEIKIIIKSILSEILTLESFDGIDESQELTDLGFDSMKAMLMVVKFEEEFDIDIQDEELLFSNFSTLLKINHFVLSKFKIFY